MAWRRVSHGDTVYDVMAAAERAGPSAAWRLVLAFRASGRRAVWAQYPLIASSRSSLFAQADRLTDEKLSAVLADHLS